MPKSVTNPRAATKDRKHHNGGITPKMERFISEYLKDLNGQAAAKRAGYSVRTAGQIARRILDNEEVQKRLKKKLNRQTRKADVTVERVLNEYAAIAFASPMHYMQVDEKGPYVDLEDLPEDYAAALSELSFEEVYIGKGPRRKKVRRCRFKLHNKTAALDSLGKYLEMFKDKGDTQITVTHEVSKVQEEVKEMFEL
jgi:phage terminase small subunit